jgi:hypothetical protein
MIIEQEQGGLDGRFELVDAQSRLSAHSMKRDAPAVEQDMYRKLAIAASRELQ